jgi:ABC-type phosphate transport system permease subunit
MNGSTLGGIAGVMLGIVSITPMIVTLIDEANRSLPKARDNGSIVY